MLYSVDIITTSKKCVTVSLNFFSLSATKFSWLLLKHYSSLSFPPHPTISSCPGLNSPCLDYSFLPDFNLYHQPSQSLMNPRTNHHYTGFLRTLFLLYRVNAQEPAGAPDHTLCGALYRHLKLLYSKSAHLTLVTVPLLVTHPYLERTLVL